MKPVQISGVEWRKYNLYFLLEHLLGFNRMDKFYGRKRNTLYNKIDERLAPNQNPLRTFDVPEFTREEAYAEKASFAKLMNGPIVFRGVAADWPCVQKWDLDFFSQNYGDREIILNDLVGIIDPNNSQTYQRILLSEYIDMLKNGSLRYLKFSSLVQKEAKLREDIEQNWLHRFDKKGAFGKTFYMFIGGKGSITPMHNEFPSVLYIQVSGRKRWVMHLPQDRIFLDPRTERRTYFYSTTIPGKPDLQKFPLKKYAREYEFIMDPGDALWFPPFAWHYVENLEESIGVSYKYAHIGSAWKSSRMLSFLFYTATKPNPFFSFLASRIKKDDYTLTKRDSELS